MDEIFSTCSEKRKLEQKTEKLSLDRETYFWENAKNLLLLSQECAF